jgi:hypothetical protein
MITPAKDEEIVEEKVEEKDEEKGEPTKMENSE